MNPALYATFRTLVQGAVSWLFAHFAILSQFTDAPTVVEWAMSAVVLAGYVYVANWLGTRTGSDRWSVLARFAAKVMMLGLTRTPTYSGGSAPSTPDTPLR